MNPKFHYADTNHFNMSRWLRTQQTRLRRFNGIQSVTKHEKSRRHVDINYN